MKLQGKNALVVSGLLTLLCGCASTTSVYGTKVRIQPGEGMVYVYRAPGSKLGLLSALIDVDGKQVAVLEQASCVALPVPIGTHRIGHQWKAGLLGNSKLENKPIERQIEVQEGRDIYLSLGASTTSQLANSMINIRFDWQLTEVSQSEAEEHVALCRPPQPAAPASLEE